MHGKRVRGKKNYSVSLTSEALLFTLHFVDQLAPAAQNL